MANRADANEASISELDALVKDYNPTCTIPAHAVDFKLMASIFENKPVRYANKWIFIALGWTFLEIVVVIIFVLCKLKKISND